jgi:hypothetical protein
MPATKKQRKTRTVKTPVKRASKPKRDLAASYNSVKRHEGTQYTGMKIGRSHKWYYDKGEWKETKITPDLWEISYSVIKRRAGKAPEGSGVPPGTGYHWYIMAHQMVNKLNANDYTTSLSGINQRKRLIELLETTLEQLKQNPVPLEFEYNDIQYKGEAIPISQACHDGICDELEVTLNGEYMGILKCTKGGWKMEGEPDKNLIKAIGNEVFLWYE